MNRSFLRTIIGRSPAGLLGLAGIVLAGIVVGVTWSASPAQAHAVLVSMIPADNSTVGKAPARVTLVFDENIRTPSKMVVSGPSGDRVDHGSTSIVDNRVSIAVRVSPRPADVGRYVVGWRVISADGHPVSGQRTFEYHPPGVKAGSAPANSAPAASSSSVPPVLWWVGGALVVALALFLLLRPRRSRRQG